MKFLITGAGGQLGQSLQARLKMSEVQVIALERNQLDITDVSKVKDCIEFHKPDVVINTSAYTNVEQAEKHPELVFLVNKQGPTNLAQACQKINSRFVHFSSDYVFSGISKEAWKVNSETVPLSVYGKSKLAGEEGVMHCYPEKSIVIRTAWLYSPFGKNFYKTILNLALNDDRQVTVVDDQIGQPTNSLDLTDLTLDAIFKKVPSGIYHGTNSGAASWYDFAIQIFQLANADTSRVVPIRTHDFGSQVPRPIYSVLDNSSWLDVGISPLGPWERSVSNSFSRVLESLG
jgi:dTDP-4-dehydrorhamnose reductase